MGRVTEDEVIAVLSCRGSCMTYQLANLITANRGYKDRVKTKQMLRVLKKMESIGKVKRVQSCYAVQLCWSPNKIEQVKQ